MAKISDVALVAGIGFVAYMIWKSGRDLSNLFGNLFGSSPLQTVVGIDKSLITSSYVTSSGQIAVVPTFDYVPAGVLVPGSVNGLVYVMYVGSREIRQVDAGYAPGFGESVYSFISVDGTLVDSTKRWVR